GRLEWTAAAPSGRTGAVQVVRIVARRPIGGPGWSGVMRLGRAEYTQLTPGGRLPAAPTENRFSMRTYGGGRETVSLIEDPRVGDATAMLADHEILPLVWTRDAYYVCRALLAVGARDRRLLAIVTEFIRWTFEVAERVDGWWPRASLASGKAKDPAFQLDQQLFPLLLAADAGRLAEAGVDAPYAAICRQTVDALLEKRTPFGLIATDETPADDPLAQPYHFSSHVLLWRVLQAYAHPEADAVRDATL